MQLLLKIRAEIRTRGWVRSANITLFYDLGAVPNPKRHKYYIFVNLVASEGDSSESFS